jgi:K+-transporting ATPase KdpF subunit
VRVDAMNAVILVTAVLLGGYLAVSLLKPEWFS